MSSSRPGLGRPDDSVIAADPAWSLAESAVRGAGVVTAWLRAWLAGTVDVDAALGAFGPTLVDGLADSPQGVSPLWALHAFRRATAASGPSGVRLALPVPGDVRGLPVGPAGRPVVAASLSAGAGVVAPGLAVVPHPGVAARWLALSWPVGPDPEPRSPEVDVRDATQALGEATRTAARVLSGMPLAELGPRLSRAYAALGASGRAAGVAEDQPGSGTPTDLPPGHDPRAVALLGRADSLACVLHAAEQAADRLTRSAAQREALGAALREPLAAVREARRAAYQASW